MLECSDHDIRAWERLVARAPAHVHQCDYYDRDARRGCRRRGKHCRTAGTTTLYVYCDDHDPGGTDPIDDGHRWTLRAQYYDTW